MISNEKVKEFMNYVNMVNGTMLKTLKHSYPKGGEWNTQVRFLPQGIEWLYYNNDKIIIMLNAGKEIVLQ